jgi:3-hydroxyisobutyrate dehydrogenase
MVFKIAFLGLGEMGSRMAAHLLAAGHDVTVWNRDAEKAIRSRDAGAVVAQSPRVAAAGADFVISMVRDDDASRRVWLDDATGALAAMIPGSIAIESSTLSLEWVRDLAARCAEQGCAFLDAPVAGSRPQAENRQLIFLAGGTAEALERASPVLSDMGSAIHHAGPVGAGALVKLVVNSLFGIQVAAFGELIEMIRRLGYDPAIVTEIIATTPVISQAAKGAAGSMLADAFAPMFPVELVEKDFGYAQKAAGAPDNAPMVAAARAVFRRALDQGFGRDNLTAVTRIYRDA